MKLDMSDWCAFRARNELKKQLNSRGVYLIARGVRRNRQPDILCRNIIYIGRATNLWERLNAFENACEYYFDSHAGGNSFHESKINPNFREKIAELREIYGKKKAKAAYKEYIKRCQEFKERWERQRNRLSVAVWTPSDRDRGKFTRLPEEHQPTDVEMTLQADFLIRHNRLPKYNKRIG